MIIEEENYLAHYGTLRKSGRYPWGSGETENIRNRTFLDCVETLRGQGYKEKEIADNYGMTILELRALKTIALNEQKMTNIARAQQLKDKGLSNVAIGEAMKINESSVRNLLAPGAAEKAQILLATADMLKREIEEKGIIDVGAYVNVGLKISPEKLKVAVAVLQEQGYKMYYPRIPQVGTGELTSFKVLAKGDIPATEVYAAAKSGAIRQIQEHSDDGGRSFLGLQPVIHVSSTRLKVNYKEDGGALADGVIYVRPNSKDLDMGDNHYAQVRIGIDGTHYLKGMAIYKDDLPNGVDLVFNTNKSSTGNKLDALKPLKTVERGPNAGKIDEDNPFGAVVKQLPKLDAHGNEIKNTNRSAMNLVNNEGDWDRWSRNLSTQFLSKQSPSLAREQLAKTVEAKKKDLDEILSLTNPVIKKKLLESYADDADSSAVHMKAQALPRQRTQVILPIPSMRDTEVYAPNFNNGERVVLIRHPHGGKFEIPELVVNNRNPEAVKLMGTGKDAIGINAKVAERLSGADFDGDTVLVIPNDSNKVQTERALQGLQGFDAKARYSLPESSPKISSQTKQKEMGLVSNLITDMTIKGASHDELAAAVRHSMVVIDAEKHHLDYKRSARDNNIKTLQAKYQPKPDGSSGGSATLISRAKSEVRINERKPRPASEGGAIDKATGELRYVETGKLYTNKKGETVPSTTKIAKLALAKDAHDLIDGPGLKIERIYADHSNQMKALANEARKVYANTGTLKKNDSAKVVYAPQVQSLKAQLIVAEQNIPRERQAQVFANQTVALKRQAYPDLEKSELKKIKGQALVAARERAGAKKERIKITDEEWDAIQAGAISNSMLERIVRHADIDELRKRATPRESPVMTDALQSRAKLLLSTGATQAEVAQQLGVALSTLKSSVISPVKE